MNSVESQVARNDERLRSLERWRIMCESIPEVLSEIIQWKKDQNGDIREIKDDIRSMKHDIEDLTIAKGRKRNRIQNRDRLLKWVLGGVAFGSFLTALLTNLL